MKQIQFDDIAALEAEISEEYGPFGGELEVTQEMINQFADVTGDHQWIHVDVERCKKESPFGGPIAHGFLTLSLLPSLKLNSSFQIVGFGNATNYGSDKLRFISPVPAGAKIHGRVRLASVSARAKGGTQITQEVAVHVVGNDRPALIYNMIVLFLPKLG